MYVRRPGAGNTRTARLARFPAPIAGLIANRSLAIPTGQNLPPGASVLRNFFPTSTGIVLRRGYDEMADTGEDGTVDAMWSYISGSNEKLFAASEDGIWDVGTGSAVLADLAVTAGDWIVTQFATSGGVFLVGVNGVDEGFVYDGSEYWPYVAGGISAIDYSSESSAFTAGETVTGGTSGASATIVRVDDQGSTGTLYVRDVTSGPFQNETITSAGGSATADAAETAHIPGISGVDSSDLSYVWAYKQRLYFIEKNSLSAWYMPADAIGGAATELPLGGVFNKGGSLVWGHTWSGDSSGEGGLSEQNVFASTEGEVVAFQGLYPGDTNTWGKVGTYRIGVPLGKRALIRAGGDLIIATSVGFVSLAEATRRDLAALGSAAISFPIEDAWRAAVARHGTTGWSCLTWAEGTMIFVVPPLPQGGTVGQFVVNSNTGAWCEFTGWRVTAMEAFQGALYFGADDGVTYRGWSTGADNGASYVGQFLPLFDDFGVVAARKVAKMARVLWRSVFRTDPSVAARFDYNQTFPPPPTGGAPASDSLWGTGEWGSALWGSSSTLKTFQRWVSVGGSGDKVSLAIQFTSGTPSPSDVEIVEVDLTYDAADIVS